MTAATSNLHTKLTEVMAAVGYIPKNGQGPGYRFVSASDVADKVREELVKRHITWLPEAIQMLSAPGELTPSGKQATMTLKVTWRVTDGDSGETATFESVGTGADSNDKAAPKAQTNALKYSFLMALSIPTGDDPEASDDQEQQPTRRPTPVPQTTTNESTGDELASDGFRTKLLAKCKTLGLTEPQIKGIYMTLIGPKVRSSKVLSTKQVELILERLDDAEFVANAKTVEAVDVAA